MTDSQERLTTKISVSLMFAAGLALSQVGWGAVAAAPQVGGPLWNSPFVAIDPYTQNGMMGRGINLVSEPNAIRAKYMKTVRDAGFRTVRLAVSNITTSDTNGRPNDEWFRDLDAMLNAALQQGLIVIIDENVSEECQSDAQACSKRLYGTWDTIASRYRNAPNNILFEILNEPHGSFTPETWNDTLREVLKVIRISNPTRNVIIGPASWNMPTALSKLILPADDGHIIVTVHYYAPLEFSEQGANWNVQTRTLRNVSWGSFAERDKLRQQFDDLRFWSLEKGRPLFVGEFGVYYEAPEKDRLHWIMSVSCSAESRGFSWAFWNFGPEFRGFDFDRDQWISSTLSALVPKRRCKSLTH